MIIINELPCELIEMIKEYMWGNVVYYKKKLNIVNTLPEYKRAILRTTLFCKIKNTMNEIEDELYCPNCGEKTLFPFTRNICYECEKFR